MAKKTTNKAKNQVEEVELELDEEDELELDGDDLELEDDLELDEDDDLEEGEEEVEEDEDDELELDEDDELELDEDDEEDDDLELDEDEDSDDEEDEEDEDDLELEEDEDDDEDLEEEDEEEEEVKPAPKKNGKGKGKTAPKKETKAPAKGKAKADTKAKGKTKAKAETTKGKGKGKGSAKVNITTRKSFDELFEEVTAKVDAYDEVMKRRAKGDSAIPPSTLISKELLLGLLAAKATESNGEYAKKMIAKVMAKLEFGLDKAEIEEQVEGYTFTRPDVDEMFKLVADVLYEVFEAGSGFQLYKTEDCNLSLRGEWVEEKISDNKHLNTTKASKIDRYLSIKAKSPAPKGKKTLGTIKKGKFIADK